MKHIFIFTICSVIFIFCITGCLEETGTGTLKITMQTGAKSFSPSVSADKIVKYIVNGTGPGNKTISEVSPSKSITIEGIPNGKWTIEASGLSDNGNEIASGSKSFSFKGAAASETVYLTNTLGTGSLTIDIKWNNDVTNPHLEFEIEDTKNNIRKSSIDIGSGETSYSMTFDEISSGYYTIKILLYNDRIFCGGCCEAFYIANNTTTTGTVSFKSDTSSSEADRSLSLPKSSSGTINAQIEESDCSLTADQTYKLTLGLKQSMNTFDDIEVLWYEDGEKISEKALSSSVNQLEFVAKKGIHIFNAVLINKTADTTASAKYVYTGFHDDPAGTAISQGTVKTDNNLKINLDSTTVVGALPDNKFLILTPGKNTLQLCHISGSGLILEQNGTYSTTMENFSCIKDATMLSSSAVSEFFLIADCKNTVTLFRYNSKKNIIEPVRRASDDSLVRYTGSFKSFASDFVQINHACIVKNSDETSTVLFTDPNTYEIFSVVCTEKGTKSENLTFKPTGQLNCQAFAACQNSIIYCCSDNLYLSVFDGRTAVSSWQSSELKNNTKPYKILFINPENILIGCEDKIMRILLKGTSGKTDILSDVDIKVNDFCLTPDGAYMFACSSDKHIYSYATDYVGNFKQLNVYTLSESLKQVVSNDVNIIAVTKSGNIEIFGISEETL